MAVVPNFLTIRSVTFALELTCERTIAIRDSAFGLASLDIGLSFLRDLDPDERVAALRAKRSFAENGCWMAPTSDDERIMADATNGAMNWLRLAGELPPINDSYHLGAGFLEHAFVMPVDVFVELVTRIVELEAGLANGTIEPRQEVPMARPSLPKPHSILERYDRLRRGERWELAQELALKVMRGEPWTPLPPEPVYEPSEPDDEDIVDSTDDAPMPREDHVPTYGLSEPIPPPQRIANHEILSELEAMVIELDAIDAIARGEAENYPDAETCTPCEMRRRRVLLELEVAGLFERSLADQARAALADLPALRAYHEAAMELDAYLDSPERAAVARRPRPDRLVDSLVSIDWFREPLGEVPEGMSPLAWLALGERVFEDNLPEGDAGRRFMTLGGHACTLFYRTEVRTKTSLWRARCR